MQNIQLFNVAPSMPSKLAFLEVLSRNCWWCWNFDAIELFRRVNPQLWKETRSNPLEFLSRIPQKRLEDLAADDGFLSHLHQVKDRFESELLYTTNGQLVRLQPECIAYFSLEYGIHESLRLYSGGLGGLAGDHLKAASDLALPVVAVGLMYRQGFFQKYLNNEGWQQESYPENEIHHMPLKKALDLEGKPVEISVRLPLDQEIKAIVWQLDVGRVPLYLLDANIPENPPEIRRITSELYGGDRQIRLRQELLLGIGGFRALIALGHEPVVCHMNEGHAAFVSIARISHMMKDKKLELDAVLEVVPRTNVFTTHTPVPAGNEAFAVDLLTPHLKALEHDLGISTENILSWGQPPQNNNYELSMTILGLRMSRYSNGVSKLHGEVERKMWRNLWNGLYEDEVPIGHVTNGVHVPSWLSRENAVLFDRYLGTDWRDNPSDPAILSRISDIPDEELWRAHELGRSRLIRIAREMAEKNLVMRNAPRTEVLHAKSVLGYDVLTIGFARRFATYKRATLLLSDPKRLEALLCNESRPIQMVFAGKAHPADHAGKELIRQIVQFAQKANIRNHIIFLENYEMHMARYLVQGTDIWLNTPRRPLEASGTSGMKAAVNGGINVSILDGWWVEGYSPDCGFAIGHGEEYDDPAYQDAIESQALYNVLENDVIPCFYDRPSRDVPDRWIKMMKASMKMALGFFTSNRMVREYDVSSYKPAFAEYKRLLANGAAEARKLVSQRTRLQSLWNNVAIQLPMSDKELPVLHVGDKFQVTSKVRLGSLRPEEVDVEVYYGAVNSENQITESNVEAMSMEQDHGKGEYTYKREITCRSAGRYGFTTRVIPHGKEWKGVMPGFITWADGGQ